MKDLKYLRLFDVYGALLTEHQREVCELYYMCDLSLTEIAQEKGISKQSVSDTLAKSRSFLDEYEEKLRFAEIERERAEGAAALARVAAALEELGARHPELYGEIRSILSLAKPEKDAGGKVE